ncbi:hypothetical protein BGZ94_004193, partial [Podila epigama]
MSSDFASSEASQIAIEINTPSGTRVIPFELEGDTMDMPVREGTSGRSSSRIGSRRFTRDRDYEQDSDIERYSGLIMKA